MLGGYYAFYRRFFYIFGIVLVGLFAYSFGAPGWLVAILAGLSLGPIVLLEQWFANRYLTGE